MSKQAISLTLHPENLLWLKARQRSQGGRSVSDTLDRLLTDVRLTAREPRSVIGRAWLDPSDPELGAAQHELGAMFDSSVERTAAELYQPARRASPGPVRPETLRETVASYGGARKGQPARKSKKSARKAGG